MTHEECKLGIWRTMYRYRIFDGDTEVLGVYAVGKHYANLDAHAAIGPAKDILAPAGSGYTVAGIDREYVDPFFDWQPLTEFG